MDPPGFFPLIVRGGRGIRAAHDGDTLTLQFGKSPVAAGDPSTYGRMPLGTAAWADRPIACGPGNCTQPLVLGPQRIPWISDPAEAAARNRAFEGFMVDDSVMAAAEPGAVFMHCLPAHRGEEVAAEVIDGPRSVVFQQAANRLPTEQAALYALATGWEG